MDPSRLGGRNNIHYPWFTSGSEPDFSMACEYLKDRFDS